MIVFTLPNIFNIKINNSHHISDISHWVISLKSALIVTNFSINKTRDIYAIFPKFHQVNFCIFLYIEKTLWQLCHSPLSALLARSFSCLTMPYLTVPNCIILLMVSWWLSLKSLRIAHRTFDKWFFIKNRNEFLQLFCFSFFLSFSTIQTLFTRVCVCCGCMCVCVGGCWEGGME